MGGTTTRRTNAPMRRQPGAAAGARTVSGVDDDPLSRIPGSAPPIAVTGMGGLRVIKAGGATGSVGGRSGMAQQRGAGAAGSRRNDRGPVGRGGTNRQTYGQGR